MSSRTGLASVSFSIVGFSLSHRNTLKSLGARHVAYGVTSDQYVYVGIALLGTLEECLGVAFDAHAREAWTALYTFVSQTMKAGAAEYQLAPARRAG